MHLAKLKDGNALFFIWEVADIKLVDCLPYSCDFIVVYDFLYSFDFTYFNEV